MARTRGTAGTLVSAALLVVAFRRAVALAAALASPRPCSSARESVPRSALVVPAHDEEIGLPRLLAALERLEYPREQMTLLFVDDGSRDGTRAALEAWVGATGWGRVVALDERRGKAGAVNAALAELGDEEVVFFLDADHAPRPDYARLLAAALAEDGVGAVAGFVSPENAKATLVSRYAALEALVHQLVTSAAKDRLDLDPPVLGAAAYRREALTTIGGFVEGRSGEDVRATAALALAGWRTRFVPAAVVDTHVAARLTDYWHQRRRWAHDAPASALPPRSAPGAQRIVESWLTALGYTDRLAFLLATVLAACGRVSALVPGAYAGIRLAEVVAVLARSRPALREWLRHAVAAALLLPVDIAVSLAAHADRRRPVWRRPPRTP